MEVPVNGKILMSCYDLCELYGLEHGGDPSLIVALGINAFIDYLLINDQLPNYSAQHYAVLDEDIKRGTFRAPFKDFFKEAEPIKEVVEESNVIDKLEEVIDEMKKQQDDDFLSKISID